MSPNAWPSVLAVGLLLAGCAQPAAPRSSPAQTSSPITSANPTPPPSPSPSPRAPEQAEAPLPAARQEVASTSAGGGVLYVIGGFDQSGRSSNSFFVRKDLWVAGPAYPLPIDHAAAAAIGGRVFVAGGYSNGIAQTAVYELGDGWGARSPMHHARGAHALLALGPRLYAIGGAAGSDVAAGEVYDTMTDTWTDLPALPASRNHVAGFTWNDQACIAGGRAPNTPRVDCYDPLARLWTRLPDLPLPTSGAGAVTLGGRVIVAGGENAAESLLVDHVFRFDGTSWSDSPMLVPRHGIQLAVFRDRAWACGGATAAGYRAAADCTSLA